MKLKRILILAVCLMMVATLFMGCGKSNTADKSASTAAVTTEATTTAATTQTEAALPDGKLSAEPVKLVYVRPTWGELKPDSEPVQRIIKKIKEKTNVELEIVTELNPAQDAANKINLMIASGDPFDMFYDGAVNFGGGKELPRLMKEDVVIPIDDLVQKYAPDALKKLDPSTWEYVKQDGKIYGIPGQMPKDLYALQYRKDWLDEAGMKVPATIEEWEKAAQYFKEKHNNIGFVQVWEYALDQHFVGSFVPVGSNTLTTSYLDTDGKIKPYYVHKNFKDYLAKMQEWYKKGYINKEIATMKQDQVFNLLNTGKAGLCHAWGDPTGFTVLAKKVDPKAEYIWGPPLNSSIQEGVFGKGDRIYDWNGVTKSCKHPDVAVRFINWSAFTTEGYELTMMGEEGYDWILGKREGDIVYYKDNDKVSKEKKCGGFVNALWVDTLFTKYFIGDTKTTYYEDCDTYKLGERPDFGLLYDNGIMKSKDKKADMDAYLLQEKYKIIMGQQPVDNWDKVIQAWMEKGGSTYIDDMTEQYNAWKAQQK